MIDKQTQELIDALYAIRKRVFEYTMSLKLDKEITKIIENTLTLEQIQYKEVNHD